MAARDTERLLKAIETLYEGVLDAEAWQRALCEVGDLVGGAGLLLGAIDPLTGSPYRHETRRIDPAAMDAYVRHWVTEDVRYEALQRAPVGAPQTEEMLVDLRRFQRSPIYNELLLPNDSPHFLSTWVQRNERRGVVLSIQGSTKRGAFTRMDARTLARVAPHVRRVVELKDRIDRLEAGAAALLDAFERLPTGVFVLDDARRILHASRVARELLAARDALVDVQGCLRCVRGPDDRRLQGALGGHDAVAADDYVRVQRAGGAPSLAVFVSALHANVRPWFGARASALVMVFDPARRHLPEAATLAEMLGITPAEARLALRLAAGDTVAGAAAALRISPHTARTQLKSIYRKTGYASQSALVRAIVLAPAGTGAQITASGPRLS